MNRHFAWIVVFAVALFFVFSSREEEGSPDDAGLEEEVPTAAVVAPAPKEEVVLRLPATKRAEVAPPAPVAPLALSQEAEAAPVPTLEPVTTSAERESSRRQGTKLAEVSSQAMDAMKRWMWAYGRGIDPRDPAFYDKLLRRNGTEGGRRRGSGSTASGNRYQRNVWAGTYFGIFSPLPDYHTTTQFWITIEAESSERGVQLVATDMTVNLQNDSGPHYSLLGFVPPFKDRKPTSYIHFPPKVMTGLTANPEACKEVVVLPFLAKTPTEQVQEFNAAVYCRVSRGGFERLGLMAFYRAESN